QYCEIRLRHASSSSQRSWSTTRHVTKKKREFYWRNKTRKHPALFPADGARRLLLKGSGAHRRSAAHTLYCGRRRPVPPEWPAHPAASESKAAGASTIIPVCSPAVLAVTTFRSQQERAENAIQGFKLKNLPRRRASAKHIQPTRGSRSRQTLGRALGTSCG